MKKQKKLSNINEQEKVNNLHVNFIAKEIEVGNPPLFSWYSKFENRNPHYRKFICLTYFLFENLASIPIIHLSVSHYDFVL